MKRTLICSIVVGAAFSFTFPALAETMPAGGLMFGTKNAYLGADVVFMRRANKGADRILVVDENTDGTPADDVPILRTRDLNAFSNFEPGFELKGGVRITERLWFGARFMWINDFKGSAAASGDTGQVGFPGGESSGPSNFGDANGFTAVLRSQLATFTLHAKYAVVPDVYVVGGFRYLRLAEQLDVNLIDLNDTPDNHSHNIRLVNNLFGGEIGLMLHRQVFPNLYLKLSGTAGVFANRTDFTRRLHTNDTAGVAAGTQIDERSQRTAFSFVGEAQVALSYEVMRNFQIFAGYRALFVTGVGLATNNVVYDINQTTGFPAQNVGISRSTAIYHGGFVGAKLVW